MKQLMICSALFFCLLFLNACAVATGIFKAGVWVGVLGVILVLAVVIYFITRSNKS